jgi:hypothetical protein
VIDRSALVQFKLHQCRPVDELKTAGFRENLRGRLSRRPMAVSISLLNCGLAGEMIKQDEI